MTAKLDSVVEKLENKESKRKEDRKEEESEDLKKWLNQNKMSSGNPGHTKKKRNRKMSRASSDDSERNKDSELDFTEENDSDEEENSKKQSRKRTARPVAGWKIRYDGKDDSRNLNKFIAEIEFFAEME